MACASRDAGIVPYINASIILQLLSTAFPGLKKMQREGGPQVLCSAPTPVAQGPASRCIRSQLVHQRLGHRVALLHKAALGVA